MAVRTFYQLAVWLPIIVPAIVALITHGAGIRPTGMARLPAQVMLSSLVGGIPYVLLALWATFWIAHPNRSEQQIRRLMIVAPLLMSVAWIVVWTFLYFGRGGSLQSADNAQFFFASSLFGTMMALALGYGYVALTLALRRVAEDVGWIRESIT